MSGHIETQTEEGLLAIPLPISLMGDLATLAVADGYELGHYVARALDAHVNGRRGFLAALEAATQKDTGGHSHG